MEKSLKRNNEVIEALLGIFLCCWWGLKRFRVRGENNQNLYFSQQLLSHLIQLLLFIQKHAFITLANNNNYNSQHRLLSHSGASAYPAAAPQTTTTILIAADPDYQVFSNIKVISLGQIESLPAHGIHCGMSWHNHVKSHSQQTRQSQSWNRTGWQNTTVQAKGSALTL